MPPSHSITADTMIGVLLPFLVATLWILSALVLIVKSGPRLVTVTIVVVWMFLFVFTWIWPLPATPDELRDTTLRN